MQWFREKGLSQKKSLHGFWFFPLRDLRQLFMFLGCRTSLFRCLHGCITYGHIVTNLPTFHVSTTTLNNKTRESKFKIPLLSQWTNPETHDATLGRNNPVITLVRFYTQEWRHRTCSQLTPTCQWTVNSLPLVRLASHHTIIRFDIVFYYFFYIVLWYFCCCWFVILIFVRMFGMLDFVVNCE